jgi:hypothetical protein
MPRNVIHLADRRGESDETDARGVDLAPAD